MKLKFASLLVVAIAAASLTLNVSAQAIKVASVDMDKVFSEYTKTKKAEADLGEKVTAYQKELSGRDAELKRLSDDFNKLREEAENPAFTEEKRAEKRKATEAKEIERRLYHQESLRIKNERERELMETRAKTMRALVDEIMKIIHDKAKKDGYTMVVDKSSMAPKGNPPTIGVPPFLFLQDSLDITPDIVKLLNSSASTTGAEKTKDKK
ncbi:MAG: OmpH family outer membrane protein [Verrucomicrobiae bacterium]|nr:OmpH family outer membrane protein [Verrucomicrobiae bacterium]